MDDSNQPVISQDLRVARSKHGAECFVKAFNASPFVQTITTFDSGRYLFVNDCFVTTAGYGRSEVIGKTPIELGLLVDKSDRRWLTQTLRQTGRLASKKLRFRLRSGEVRIGLLNSEILRLEGETLILSTVADVTSQLAAERHYRLERKRVALVEQLAAGLAHEVKNPLAGIKGVADSFLHRRRLTKQEREWMEAVRLGVSQIDAQTQDLLHLAYPRSRNPAFFSLNRLVRRVVVLARHQANSSHPRSILIEVKDVSGDALYLAGDPVQLEAALLNLLLNGIEAIADEGRVTVRLSKRRNYLREDEALIAVTDNGRGISAADFPRIFKPFFTTKAEGSGMGLSTVKRTVTAFNGRLILKSRPGGGSCFELALPLPAIQPDSHAN